MKIRKAEIRDLCALKLISNEQFKNENLRPKFKHLQKNANYQIKIIEDEDIIFGYIVIKCLDKYLLDIYSMAIKQEYQGKGYGYKFLRYILESFNGHKFNLEVSEENNAKYLYIKCGFKIDGVRKGYYGKKDAILMSCYVFRPGSEES